MWQQIVFLARVFESITNCSAYRRWVSAAQCTIYVSHGRNAELLASMLAAGREAYAWCREFGLQSHIDIKQLGSRAGMYYSLVNRRSHFLFRYFGRKW
jgi:hypothetical protein